MSATCDSSDSRNRRHTGFPAPVWSPEALDESLADEISELPSPCANDVHRWRPGIVGSQEPLFAGGAVSCFLASAQGGRLTGQSYFAGAGWKRGLKRPLDGLPKGPVPCPHLGLFPVMNVPSCIRLRHFISRLSLQSLVPSYAS